MVMITSNVVTVTTITTLGPTVTNTRSSHSFSTTTQAVFISGHQGYYQLFILSLPLQGWHSNFTIFNRLVYLRSQQPPSLRNEYRNRHSFTTLMSSLTDERVECTVIRVTCGRRIPSLLCFLSYC